VRPEWNIELSKGDMDQVEELLDTIAAHKLMGVTGCNIHVIRNIDTRY
jgi:hypothetical protein